MKKWNLYTENIEEKHSQNFEIENNPYSDNIIIKSINNIVSNIKIFNINGCVILDKNTKRILKSTSVNYPLVDDDVSRNTNGNETLNIKNAKGLYILQITDKDKNIHIRKIIKH